MVVQELFKEYQKLGQLGQFGASTPSKTQGKLKLMDYQAPFGICCPSGQLEVCIPLA